MKTEIRYFCGHCGREIKQGETFAIIEETLCTTDKYGTLYKDENIALKNVYCASCHTAIDKMDNKINELIEVADEYLKAKNKKE